jgi:excisionase family DNA binding protein
MTGNEDWYSTPDAAHALGITPRTLYRFINNGMIDAYRFGRVIRVKKTDIDEFISKSRIQPGTIATMAEGEDEEAEVE